MAVRPIDGNELLNIMRLLDTDIVRQSKTASWLLEQVLHDIQAMPTLDTPNQWVSVKDRLPEEDGYYIVVACDENLPYGEGIWYSTVVVCAEYCGGYLNTSESWTWCEGGTTYDVTDIVTHWVPLPEPPSRED